MEIVRKTGPSPSYLCKGRHGIYSHPQTSANLTKNGASALFYVENE